ncbi:MAG TPA: galactokinase [Candidatus Sulfotelmatobacter sp.]|nr:galactokinase [Candidatus Sulfotelmatobacter sp.]
MGKTLSTPESLEHLFRQEYGTRPRIFRAPGRVNLIGEHTDYNDGFVMPVAIGFDTWIGVGPRPDRILRAHSTNFSETLEFSLDSLAGPPRKHWSDFVRGVASVLQSNGQHLTGANLMIHGNVPMGAGLSSSASLEVAIALALLGTSEAEAAPLDLVKWCQRAEHEFVGTRCGIMDQFIAVFGEAGRALMLDCRSLQHELVQIPAEARLIICNSMVKHNLASGEYNRRRADCEAGVGILRKHVPEAKALRDVSLDNLERYRRELPDVIYRRCRHVISENHRVSHAASALQSKDLHQFGRLMRESHHSLRDDYEVSCHELDILVEIACECDGVYGSRMTGGGFGGCTITVAKAESANAFQEIVSTRYKEQTGITPAIYVCSASQGGGEWLGRG